MPLNTINSLVFGAVTSPYHLEESMQSQLTTFYWYSLNRVLISWYFKTYYCKIHCFFPFYSCMVWGNPNNDKLTSARAFSRVGPQHPSNLTPRIIYTSLKEGQNRGIGTSLRKLSIKWPLAPHVSEPTLKVEWDFMNLLFSSLKLWKNFKI